MAIPGGDWRQCAETISFRHKQKNSSPASRNEQARNIIRVAITAAEYLSKLLRFGQLLQTILVDGGSEGGVRGSRRLGLKSGQYPSIPPVDSLIQASYNLGVGYRFCFECH